MEAPMSVMDTYVSYEGSILPPYELRTNGPGFRDDAFYLATAKRDAQRLVDQLACTQDTVILDVGCASGRLAIGFLNVLGAVDYTGLDVRAKSVEWCKRHIERRHTSFKFRHIDVANARYNEGGIPIDEHFRFDLPDRHFDVICLLSVFTHMLETDVRAYLCEFRRVLKPTGRIFLTATVDEGGAAVTINPPGYVANLQGQLHVVRYETSFFSALVHKEGFQIDAFTHKADAPSQSIFVLSRG